MANIKRHGVVRNVGVLMTLIQITRNSSYSCTQLPYETSLSLVDGIVSDILSTFSGHSASELRKRPANRNLKDSRMLSRRLHHSTRYTATSPRKKDQRVQKDIHQFRTMKGFLQNQIRFGITMVSSGASWSLFEQGGHRLHLETQMRNWIITA